MKKLEDVFTEYFDDKLRCLKKTYKWKIGKIPGFHRCDESGYDANAELKRYLVGKWETSSKEEKADLAKVIVGVWGGIGANHCSTLARYVEEISSPNPGTPFKGIASYSKIYAVAFPERYVIYDARVAACLIAVQYLYCATSGYAFPYCSGRNKITGDAKKRRGFRYKDEFRIKTLVDNGWKYVDHRNAYNTYLGLLKTCKSRFADYNLYDLEMVLFSNAEAECEKAMRKVT